MGLDRYMQKTSLHTNFSLLFLTSCKTLQTKTNFSLLFLTNCKTLQTRTMGLGRYIQKTSINIQTSSLKTTHYDYYYDYYYGGIDTDTARKLRTHLIYSPNAKSHYSVTFYWNSKLKIEKEARNLTGAIRCLNEPIASLYFLQKRDTKQPKLRTLC